MEKVQSYDVVVVGGGAAGIAAAVGAAQAGAACLLVERNGSLGGQATNANVASYCGFFTHSNPHIKATPANWINNNGGVLASRYWSCFMSWGLMTAIGSPLYKMPSSLWMRRL